ncbi:unnamed protein product [Bubo scandiacus]
MGSRGGLKRRGWARGAAQRDGQTAQCWAPRTGLATSRAPNGQIGCVGLHTISANERSYLCEVIGNSIYLASFLLTLVEFRCPNVGLEVRHVLLGLRSICGDAARSSAGSGTVWFHRWLLLSSGNASTFASESEMLWDLVTLVSLSLTAAVDSVGVPGKSQISREVKSI